MKTRSKFTINIFTLLALPASLLGSAVFVAPVCAASIVDAKTTDIANGICDADPLF